MQMYARKMCERNRKRLGPAAKSARHAGVCTGVDELSLSEGRIFTFPIASHFYRG